MPSNQFKAASMKNLQNPVAPFVASFDFGPLKKQHSTCFDRPTNKIDDPEKIRIVRQSLHRYIFVICHTIQHFGHHLTATERKLVREACDQTLQSMWRDEKKSLDDYRRGISQLLRICATPMQRLFQSEQRMTMEKTFAQNIDQI